MLQHTVGSALGFLVLSFMAWSITFAILVFGMMLRRKILLWDDNWKETVEQQMGVSVRDYAEDLERSFEKVRSTFRLLGGFLVIIVAIMAYVVYLGTLEKPVLGPFQVASGLWLLVLVVLSVVLPAFINFGMGTYLAETMLLKANSFVFVEVRDEMREKKVKIRMMEKAKEIRAQRDAMRTAPAPEATPEPAKPEEPKDKKKAAAGKK